jgi:hypothetical protein
MTVDGLGRPLTRTDKSVRAGRAIDPVEYANRTHTEHAEQVALFAWASLPHIAAQYPELEHMFAIPNGGLRDPITASNLKAEGVRDGVSDVFLPVARHGCHGLFLEMKRPKSDKGAAGREAKNQAKFSAAMRKNGYGTFLAVGWEAARDVIVQYLS